MGKLAMPGRLVAAFLPEGVVKVLSPKRDVYRGEMIDPKAYAVGRLADCIRVPGELPSLEEGRELLRKMAGMLDKKDPPLARHEDITVDGAKGPLKARLYSDQADTSTPLPAMIFYHGGGFVPGRS